MRRASVAHSIAISMGLLALMAGCASPAKPARRADAGAVSDPVPDTAPRSPPAAQSETGVHAPSADSAYVSLDVEDADLHEVLRNISREAGVSIVADPEIKETVTLTLERVEWRNALDLIAAQTNCEIVTEPALGRSGRSEERVRFTRVPSVSMEFRDADLRTVLLLIAKQGNVNLVVAENVRGTITINLRGVPWREALETVARATGYVVVPVRSGAGSSRASFRVRRP